jgi:hypothetical protein
MNLPGARLLSWGRRYLDRQTVERIVEPLVADMRWECVEADRTGNRWRRRRVVAAAYLGAAKALFLCAIALSMRAASTWPIADRRRLYQVGLFTAFAVWICALAFQPRPSLPRPGMNLHRLMLLLRPGTLVMALPIGVFVGILAGLRGRPASRRVYACCVVLGLLSALSLFAIAGWIAPRANQTFRVAMAGRTIEPGLAELTLGELSEREIALRLKGQIGEAERAARARRLRLYFPLAGLFLACAAIVASALVARHRT